LGSSLRWHLKDRYDNAHSFWKKQILGSQLVKMDVDDLRKLNIVKKLGRRIHIVKAVSVLKHRANVMEPLIKRYAGYLGNGSKTVSDTFMSKKSLFIDGIKFSINKSDEHPFVDSREVDSNLGEYHRTRPSTRNPRTYKA